MCSQIAAKPRGVGRAPRPPSRQHAYFKWRAVFLKDPETLEQMRAMTKEQRSDFISQSWFQLSAEERQPFKEAAEQEKAQFASTYADLPRPQGAYTGQLQICCWRCIFADCC